MRKLSKEATVVFKKLLSLVKNDYAKVDNSEGLFMPVVVEIIYRDKDYDDVSIAHYYEQNGDLIADPEMCFAVMRETGLVYPHYFKQGNINYEQEIFFHVEKGVPTLDKQYNVEAQSEQAAFAELWMGNIKEQQEL